MIFWLMIFAMVAYPVGAFVLARKSRYDTDVIGCSVVTGIFVYGFSGIAIFSVWVTHASDISKVIAQEHRIEVQQDRIESLSNRLDTFSFPEKSAISLDADYPWAAIVKSLTDAEDKLAEARDERAIAIRSIEARKRGPMSGVVTLVGDYD